MSRRTTARSRGKLARVLSALVAVGLCSGAVAYAAGGLAENREVKTSPAADPAPGGGPKPAEGGERKRGERLLLPSFIEHPEATTTVAEPQFRFHVPPRAPDRSGSLPDPSAPAASPQPPRRFQCRLDGGEWRGCGSPHRFAELGLGEHHFAVRAFTRDGRPGPAAGYSWRQLQRFVALTSETAVAPAPAPEGDPEQFTIEARSAGLESLYPGDPAQSLPILISNPHPVAIEVTSLSVAVAAGSPGCGAENFEPVPSSASPSAPLPVPAEGSVSLPSATVSAPSIAMLDLPVSQDACQGAEVPLVFSGEAQG